MKKSCCEVKVSRTPKGYALEIEDKDLGKKCKDALEKCAEKGHCECLENCAC